jgi:nucleotide-binding universal stress UspA family protein
MFAHIVVALDGSEVAERVLPYVEALAEKFGSRVTLVRANTPPETIALEEASAPTPAMLVPSLDPTTIANDEQRAASAYLQPLAERLKARGLAVDVSLPEDAPAAAIVGFARSSQADLIAMTTHGYGGLTRVMLGSVADEVMRTASCPVLLIRIQE